MENASLQIPVDDFFNLICRNANIGCWSFHLQSRDVWFSDACYQMLDITNESELQSLEHFLDNIVHPTDRHIITKAIKQFFYQHVLLCKDEVRLKNKENIFRWFEICAEARCDEEGNIEYLIGTIINIDERKLHEHESKTLKSFVDIINETMSIGTIEIDFLKGERYLSKTIYDIYELPYNTPASQLRREEFYEPKDIKRLEAAIAELQQTQKPYDLELQVITAKKNTCWIRAVAKPVLDKKGNVIGSRGTVQKIEKEKLKENFLLEIRDKIKEQKFFLDETSAMSDVGGWEMDLETEVLFWSDQTRRIHGVDKGYIPSFEKAIAFYTSSSCEILLKHFNTLLETGNPYDLELEITTTSSDMIWVRAIGKPVYHLGKIIKVRGVIQNITKQKHREIEMNSALNIINGQNDKLKDFTYIVSHNLRSHAGNLKMITEMVELEKDLEAKLEWIELVKNVSASLSQTVNNLNGLVTLNIENKKRLSFTDTFNIIQKALNYKILNEEAELITDFSACEWVDYVPAYLESIMLNLITNAIKYKHSERKPVISLNTTFENNRLQLKIRDNGLGIDLQTYGSRLFKMNQTFHQNSDARGIGLYITKNQVEAMGGTIEVDSIVNEGTTFIVNF